jgi:hypothetical protein
LDHSVLRIQIYIYRFTKEHALGNWYMNQPSVFISCVSPEFRQTRSKVANILTGLAYTPVFQEIFGTQSGDLRQVLRDKIDACAGLIQIVGYAYGAEPPTVDAGYGRVSYTQFEFLYAREKTKKTWLLFPGDACTRDTSVEGLDLPSGPGSGFDKQTYPLGSPDIPPRDPLARSHNYTQ